MTSWAAGALAADWSAERSRRPSSKTPAWWRPRAPRQHGVRRSCCPRPFVCGASSGCECVSGLWADDVDDDVDDEWFQTATVLPHFPLSSRRNFLHFRSKCSSLDLRHPAEVVFQSVVVSSSIYNDGPEPSNWTPAQGTKQFVVTLLCFCPEGRLYTARSCAWRDAARGPLGGSTTWWKEIWNLWSLQTGRPRSVR